MIPIKIQCGCGQRYSFEVQPVNARMPSPVSCPVCGADGTEAANQIIAQSQVSSPATPGSGLRVRKESASPAPPPPPPVAHPLRVPAAAAVGKQKSKMAWYEHAWVALPVVLVAFGGAIGGACGGAAWGINEGVFRKTTNRLLRYLCTGLISMAAVAAYLAIATSVLSLFPNGNQIATAASAQTFDWKTFTSPDGGFSVLFPGTPQEKTADRILFKMHSLTCEPSQKCVFMVGYGDYLKKLKIRPTDAFFEGVRKGVVGKDGKLLQENPITIQGFPGREIRFTKQDGKILLVSHYFLKGTRLYEVIAAVPKEEEDSTNIPYFLASFHLLKTPR